LKRITTILVFLVLWSPSGSGQTVSTGGQESYGQSSGMALLYDSTRSLGIEEVASSARAAEFVPFTQDRIRQIGTNLHAWVRIEVTNQSTRRHWLLASRYLWLARFDLYRQDAQGHWRMLPHGMLLDRTLWPYDHRLMVHPLELDYGRTEVMYLKIEANSSELWLSLVTADQLGRTERVHAGLSMLYLGLCLVMVVYNLFLAASLRDWNYVYYVGFVLSFTLGNTHYGGYTYPLLWPHFPWFNLWADLLFWWLGLWSGTLFCLRFLGVAARSPRLAKVVSRASLAGVVLPLGNYLYSQALFYELFYYLALVQFLVMFGLGVRAYRSGMTQARFYLVGWGALVVANSLSILVVLNLLPQTEFFDWTRQLGSAFEIVFFSFALADRISQLNREKLDAQRHLAQAAEQEAEVLEKRVAERTAEIRVANETKDKFFSIISHDLRGPIGSLSFLFNEVLQRPEEFDQEVLEITRQTTKTTHQLLNDLLDWAQSQSGHLLPEPTWFDLAVPLKKMAELLGHQARQKKIELTLDNPKPVWVYADPAMVTTVVRNLCSNAIKYTPVGGKVTVGARTEGGTALCFVEDTGLGVSQEQLSRLFSPAERVQSALGTASETGSGLGLILCKEFVEKNGGTLGAESTLGQGSRFWFRLPVTGEASERLDLGQEAL